MKRSQVVVVWPEGVHLRAAAKLVRTSEKFQSTVLLKCGGRIADLRSIWSIIALCATMGAIIELEATGEDEQEAVQAVEQVFAWRDGADVFPKGKC